MADFKAISPRNRMSIAYFGLKHWKKGLMTLFGKIKLRILKTFEVN
ncbi:hypothetical protein ADICYQ_2315 [Cyclobacterium qasimii M12-11B]|uniref:Uncharacterized protein n=1 Tax=Cyclobacterium qasimii M12-11B TaxID=641524 RepID=S7WXC2_9BACT|nr:hypothetical protein ADICYQ_2315 [Cyclobacterium qasimii M12-11B]